ncbi:unnamed protein product [Rotaria sp. Silwood2]|nr:unnamed protein product [Rotaria sp. Silwood2]CAF4231007.1 unnamed protein product [Rotaria sp. Silwood2]
MCPKDYLIEQLKLQQQKERERIAKQQEEERGKYRKAQEKDQKRLAKEREKALQELARIEKQKETLAERKLAKQHYREIVIDLTDEDILLENILSAERMEVLNTQPCPNCHARIEKNGGCSHMHCSRCDFRFNWSSPEGPRPPEITSLLYLSSNGLSVQSIKEELNKKSDTAKVTEPNIEKTDSDQLTEDENKQDTKILINNRSFIGSSIVKRVTQCQNTSCNKFNVKIADDNWIVCSGCFKQYCFSCLNTIKGPMHFQKECDRYTPV